MRARQGCESRNSMTSSGPWMSCSRPSMMEYMCPRLFCLVALRSIRSTWMRKGCGSRISQTWAYAESQLARQYHMEDQMQIPVRCLAAAIASLKAQEKIISVRRIRHEYE